MGAASTIGSASTIIGQLQTRQHLSKRTLSNFSIEGRIRNLLRAGRGR